jgi:hypothetical protein
MNLAALTLLDIDDIEVVETGDLAAVSTSPGMVTVHRAPSALAVPATCEPFHTHAVGARPSALAVPATCEPFHTHAVGARPSALAVPATCEPFHTHAVGARPVAE